jgi:hypothetical protein
VRVEDFETFVNKEWPVYTPYPGWQVHVLKGDRGDRDGEYLVLLEIESVEARDRIFPRAGEKSEYGKQFDEDHPECPPIFEKLWTLVDNSGFPFTDYVRIG